MKLDYRKTVFVGFAFFLICAFWQAYDTLVPKILTDKFGLSQTLSGFIMALDNIVALFLLPLFGAISDRHNSRYGRRTPFIVIGTVAAILLILPLTYADHLQTVNLSDITGDRETALSAIWDADVEIRDPVTGNTVDLTSLFESKEEFTSIPVFAGEGSDSLSADYSDYVIPARQAYARQMTFSHPGVLVFFMLALLLLLLVMAVFRSPAVALMPDVTVKPLRSKANAVINLMGAAGGILTLVLGILFSTGKPENALMPYGLFFFCIAGIMAVSLAIFLFKVREPKMVTQMQEESRRLGIPMEPDGESPEEPEPDGKNEAEVSASHVKPDRGAFVSMILILTSVVFWFMGYNAVSSKYSVYAGSVLGLDYNTTLLLAQAVAIVSYIPIGILSSRIGRKRMIIAGIVCLFTSFFSISFLGAGSPLIAVNILFSLAGIGWASINVNSFPMVVELCRSGSVGKYTGYYYTASMAAQTLTPILSGVFLDNIGMKALFPYASVFVLAAFFTMLFVRHGDASRVAEPHSEA